MNEELKTIAAKYRHGVIFQLSNTDAGVETFRDVVTELRKLMPGVPMVVLEMCDVYNNVAANGKLNKIFDQVIKLSDYTGLNTHSSPGQVRSNAAKAYDSLLKEMRPRVAVVSNDRAFVEEELVKQLRLNGVPSVLMQESIRRDRVHQKFSEGLAHGRGNCDLVLAWGEQGKEYFKAVGVPADRIRVVGSPRLDRLVKTTKNINTENVLNKLGIEQKSRVVLLTTSPMTSLSSMTEENMGTG